MMGELYMKSKLDSMKLSKDPCGLNRKQHTQPSASNQVATAVGFRLENVSRSEQIMTSMWYLHTYVPLLEVMAACTAYPFASNQRLGSILYVIYWTSGSGAASATLR